MNWIFRKLYTYIYAYDTFISFLLKDLIEQLVLRNVPIKEEIKKVAGRAVFEELRPTFELLQNILGI